MALSWLLVVVGFVLLMAWICLLMVGMLVAAGNMPFPAAVNALLMIPAALGAVALGIWSFSKVLRL